MEDTSLASNIENTYHNTIPTPVRILYNSFMVGQIIIHVTNVS